MIDIWVSNEKNWQVKKVQKSDSKSLSFERIRNKKKSITIHTQIDDETVMDDGMLTREWEW